MSPNRNLARRRAPRIIALAALALPALSLSACTGSTEKTPDPTPTAAESTEAEPTPLPGGHHYAVMDNLCDYVSLVEIVKVLPHVVTDLNQPESVAPDVYFSCEAVLGTNAVPELGTFAIAITLYEDDVTAQAGFRSLHDDTTDTITDVTGLGQGAFRAVDSSHDPAVYVLDGNAVIESSWVTIYGNQPPAADTLLPALETTLRTTLPSLPKT